MLSARVSPRIPALDAEYGVERGAAVPLGRLLAAHDLLPAVRHTGGAAIGDHDRGAVGGQRPCDRLTAAIRLAAAGDQRHTPGHETFSGWVRLTPGYGWRAGP